MVGRMASTHQGSTINRERNLSVNGLKPVLRERLLHYMEHDPAAIRRRMVRCSLALTVVLSHSFTLSPLGLCFYLYRQVHAPPVPLKICKTKEPSRLVDFFIYYILFVSAAALWLPPLLFNRACTAMGPCKAAEERAVVPGGVGYWWLSDPCLLLKIGACSAHNRSLTSFGRGGEMRAT